MLSLHSFGALHQSSNTRHPLTAPATDTEWVSLADTGKIFKSNPLPHRGTIEHARLSAQMASRSQWGGTFEPRCLIGQLTVMSANALGLSHSCVTAPWLLLSAPQHYVLLAPFIDRGTALSHTRSREGSTRTRTSHNGAKQSVTPFHVDLHAIPAYVPVLVLVDSTQCPLSKLERMFRLSCPSAPPTGMKLFDRIVLACWTKHYFRPYG